MILTPFSVVGILVFYLTIKWHLPVMENDLKAELAHGKPLAEIKATLLHAEFV